MAGQYDYILDYINTGNMAALVAPPLPVQTQTQEQKPQEQNLLSGFLSGAGNLLGNVVRTPGNLLGGGLDAVGLGAVGDVVRAPGNLAGAGFDIAGNITGSIARAAPNVLSTVGNVVSGGTAAALSPFFNKDPGRMFQKGYEYNNQQLRDRTGTLLGTKDGYNALDFALDAITIAGPVSSAFGASLKAAPLWAKPFVALDQGVGVLGSAVSGGATALGKPIAAIGSAIASPALGRSFTEGAKLGFQRGLFSGEGALANLTANILTRASSNKLGAKLWGVTDEFANSLVASGTDDAGKLAFRDALSSRINTNLGAAIEAMPFVAGINAISLANPDAGNIVSKVIGAQLQGQIFDNLLDIANPKVNYGLGGFLKDVKNFNLNVANPQGFENLVSNTIDIGTAAAQSVASGDYSILASKLTPESLTENFLLYGNIPQSSRVRRTNATQTVEGIVESTRRDSPELVADVRANAESFVTRAAQDPAYLQRFFDNKDGTPNFDMGRVGYALKNGLDTVRQDGSVDETPLIREMLNQPAAKQLLDDVSTLGQDVAIKKFIAEQKLEDTPANLEVTKNLLDVLNQGNVALQTRSRASTENLVETVQANLQVALNESQRAVLATDISALKDRLVGQNIALEIADNIIGRPEILGMFKDGTITLKRGNINIKDTALEEIGHAVFGSFLEDADRQALVDAVIKRDGAEGIIAKLDPRYAELYGNDVNALAEEAIMQDFVKYANSAGRAAPKGITGKIKALFDKLIGNLKGSLAAKDDITDFYDRLLAGAYAGPRGLELAADGARFSLEAALPKDDDIEKRNKEIDFENAVIANESSIINREEYVSKTPGLESEVIYNITEDTAKLNDFNADPVDSRTLPDPDAVIPPAVDGDELPSADPLPFTAEFALATDPQTLLLQGLSREAFSQLSDRLSAENNPISRNDIFIKINALLDFTRANGRLDAAAQISQVLRHYADNTYKIKGPKSISAVADKILGGDFVCNTFTTRVAFQDDIKDSNLAYQASAVYAGAILKGIHSIDVNVTAALPLAASVERLAESNHAMATEISKRSQVDNAISTTFDRIDASDPAIRRADIRNKIEHIDGMVLMNRVLRRTDDPITGEGWTNKLVSGYEQLISDGASANEKRKFIRNARDWLRSTFQSYAEFSLAVQADGKKSPDWIKPTVEARSTILNTMRQAIERFEKTVPIVNKRARIRNTDRIIESLGELEIAGKAMLEAVKSAPNEAGFDTATTRARWDEIGRIDREIYDPLINDYYQGMLSALGLPADPFSDPIAGSVYVPRIGARTVDGQEQTTYASGELFVEPTASDFLYSVISKKAAPSRLKDSRGIIKQTEVYTDAVMSGFLDNLKGSYRTAAVTYPVYNMWYDVRRIARKIENKLKTVENGGFSQREIDATSLHGLGEVASRVLQTAVAPPTAFDAFLKWTASAIQSGVTLSKALPITLAQWQSLVGMARVANFSQFGLSYTEQLQATMRGVLGTVPFRRRYDAKKAENVIQEIIADIFVNRKASNAESKAIARAKFNRNIGRMREAGLITKNTSRRRIREFFNLIRAPFEYMTSRLISIANDRITSGAAYEIEFILQKLNERQPLTPDQTRFFANMMFTAINGEPSTALAGNKKGISAFLQAVPFVKTLIDTSGTGAKVGIGEFTRVLGDMFISPKSRNLQQRILEVEVGGQTYRARAGRARKGGKAAGNLVYGTIMASIMFMLYNLFRGGLSGKINPFSEEAKANPGKYMIKSLIPNWSQFFGDTWLNIPTGILMDPASGLTTIKDSLELIGSIATVNTNGLEKTTSEAMSKMMELAGLGYYYRALNLASSSTRAEQTAEIDIQDLLFAKDNTKVKRDSAGNIDPVSFLSYGLLGLNLVPQKERTTSNLMSLVLGSDAEKAKAVAGLNSQGIASSSSGGSTSVAVKNSTPRLSTGRKKSKASLFSVAKIKKPRKVRLKKVKILKPKRIRIAKPKKVSLTTTLRQRQRNLFG